VEETIKRLKDIEKSIEDAMWASVVDDDQEKALSVYADARDQLEALEIESEDAERERRRILSYCLLRINDALDRLERLDERIERAQESLDHALASNDRAQILRSKLALGIAHLNSGDLETAEDYFAEIIEEADREDEDRDVVQVFGWTLVARTNILLGKSLYNQALNLGMEALGVLGGIKNYAGLRAASSAVSRAYRSLGDEAEADEYKKQAEQYDRLAKKHRR
jgi:hypothetical protein